MQQSDNSDEIHSIITEKWALYQKERAKQKLTNDLENVVSSIYEYFVSKVIIELIEKKILPKHVSSVYINLENFINHDKTFSTELNLLTKKSESEKEYEIKIMKNKILFALYCKMTLYVSSETTAPSPVFFESYWKQYHESNDKIAFLKNLFKEVDFFIKILNILDDQKPSIQEKTPIYQALRAFTELKLEEDRYLNQTKCLHTSLLQFSIFKSTILHVIKPLKAGKSKVFYFSKSNVISLLIDCIKTFVPVFREGDYPRDSDTGALFILAYTDLLLELLINSSDESNNITTDSTIVDLSKNLEDDSELKALYDTMCCKYDKESANYPGILDENHEINAKYNRTQDNDIQKDVSSTLNLTRNKTDLTKRLFSLYIEHQRFPRLEAKQENISFFTKKTDERNFLSEKELITFGNKIDKLNSNQLKTVCLDLYNYLNQAKTLLLENQPNSLLKNTISIDDLIKEIDTYYQQKMNVWFSGSLFRYKDFEDEQLNILNNLKLELNNSENSTNFYTQKNIDALIDAFSQLYQLTQKHNYDNNYDTWAIGLNTIKFLAKLLFKSIGTLIPAIQFANFSEISNQPNAEDKGRWFGYGF